MSRTQSRIRVMPQSSKKWMIALSASTLAGLALLGWSRQQQAQGSRVTDAYSASQTRAAADTLAGGVASLASVDAKVLLDQQAVAAKALAQQPDLKPITGVVSERPSYVSRLEWVMMQGVAQQHANPDQELNHLVNFLRFNKQQELWESLPHGAANALTRQSVALSLLEDLPQRLRSGDFDLKGAQRLQASLLMDAVPDAQQRAQRAEQEAQRLQEAAR